MKQNENEKKSSSLKIRAYVCIKWDIKSVRGVFWLKSKRTAMISQNLFVFLGVWTAFDVAIAVAFMLGVKRVFFHKVEEIVAQSSVAQRPSGCTSEINL